MLRQKSSLVPWHLGWYILSFTVLSLGLNNPVRLLRSAKWRKAPATDGQKALVVKRMSKERLEKGGLANLTKGEAANIIARVKHGAKVRAIDLIQSRER